jgi:hypothetical protein
LRPARLMSITTYSARDGEEIAGEILVKIIAAVKGSPSTWVNCLMVMIVNTHTRIRLKSQSHRYASCDRGRTAKEAARVHRKA